MCDSQRLVLLRLFFPSRRRATKARPPPAPTQTPPTSQDLLFDVPTAPAPLATAIRPTPPARGRAGASRRAARASSPPCQVLSNRKKPPPATSLEHRLHGHQKMNEEVPPVLTSSPGYPNPSTFLVMSKQAEAASSSGKDLRIQRPDMMPKWSLLTT